MGLKAIKGDITLLPVDAVINAANSSLLGGGGVDGAIHRAAGHKLLDECRTLNGCQSGQAKLTGAYELPARYVIHTVGPVWEGGFQGEAELLASCYLNSLQLANKKGLQSVAFPAVSCGAYGYPVEKAAAIAVRTCISFIKTLDMDITFCLFSDEDLKVYEKIIQSIDSSALPISHEEAICGALIGAATGDAMGLPVEFMSREHLIAEPVSGFRSQGTHQQEAGTWADSTSLILCTLQSLLTKGFDLRDIMKKFSMWKQRGYLTAHNEAFKIGHTTDEAIKKYLAGEPREAWSSSQDWQNGNGALTRILPLALYVWKEPVGNAIEKVFLGSSLTHGHIRSQLSCAFFSLIVRYILDGDTLKQALENAVREITPYVPDSEDKHFTEVCNLSFLAKSVDEINSSRYVLHTLQTAIYSVYHSKNFNEALLNVVNLGEDTPSTGCLSGALAGLIYGVDQIPFSWRNNLAGIDMLQQMAEDFTLKILKPEEA